MKRLFPLKKHLPIVLATLAGVFLLTTGFQRYQVHPLTSVASEVLPSLYLSDVRITVSAKALNGDESKRAFGHNLLSRGVKPLQLTIQNNTSNEYSMSTSSVDLPGLEPRKVAHKVTDAAIPRSIGYKIAGFFFWPFMIPGTIDSILVMAHHQKLKKDLTAKSLKKEVVAPYSTFNRVVFVPEDKFQESFKVTLIDIETLRPTEFQTTVNPTEAQPVAEENP